MHTNNVKYGFLTTYNQTVFLKQEPHPRNRRRWVLWHSPVIYHDAPSRCIEGDPRNVLSFRNRVSLRECFLFLVRKVCSGDYYTENQMGEEQWFAPNLLSKGSDSDYVTDSSSDSQESQEGSPPRSSGRQTIGSTNRPSSNSPSRGPSNMPATGFQPQQMGMRTSRTSQPNITSQARQSASRSRDLIAVYLDPRRRQWFYPDSTGHAVFIDLKQGATEDD
jgi:hypothetical protein